MDAIILAHVKPADQSITLLNVPRDLYVNNRKINSIWMSFGMEEFKRQLTNLTGYEIDRYALIDMYAFIDVIDIIGGVDVTLTETVIDPTYRTYDNGQWGTLYYPPGTYHLNGRQSLRLARSRHFSSDFKRAERQQLILESLKAKALTLNPGDSDKILDIIKTGIDQTETDFTPQEALTYLLRFKGFTVDRGHVLSTGNILYSKRQHSEEFTEAEQACAELTDPEAKQACEEELEDFDKGAYILLPHEDNWQLIRWFVWQKFEK